MRSRDTSSAKHDPRPDEDRTAADDVPPSMAVSIAGVSRACSKDALVSSAKAAREALSTE
ncbi:MAG TPA: hypothetical protein VGY51_06135 [Acidimicrobiales bacterium]|nr:hypothetical protein [Acidimicrobiales bacterium]